MSPLSVTVLALSMSADAFCAAVGRGASHRPSPGQALRAGAVFGVVEAATPLLGWALGLAAAAAIQAVDHWIAFGLLAGVGLHMIWHALTDHRRREAPRAFGLATGGRLALVATAVGTSIDAAAVGVSLAFLEANIVVVALAIGLATFLMATIGMLIGRAAGPKLGARAELIGGIALILLGGKILFEHLGVWG